MLAIMKRGFLAPCAAVTGFLQGGLDGGTEQVENTKVGMTWTFFFSCYLGGSHAEML